jgi:hypothetical protein
MQRNANIRLQQQQAAVSSASSLLSPSALAVPPPPIPAALRSNLNRASPTSPAPISGEQDYRTQFIRIQGKIEMNGNVQYFNYLFCSNVDPAASSTFNISHLASIPTG